MHKDTKHPLFSIIIPTYNRADYLRFTLDTCRDQKFDSVEFIIQDDNSSDHTADVADFYVRSDNRFRYCNIGQNAGMRGNFENSLRNATGEYLIFLGGDDALIPDGLSDIANIIDRHPAKIITWPVPTYYYDEVRQGEGQIIAAHCIFQPLVEIELLSKDYFERQANVLFYVSDEKSPMIYVKSAIPRTLIDEVKKRSNNLFFSSSTPDGYSGFALASIVEKYLYTNKPFTMHGVSPSSAGLNYVRGANDANDHSNKFFRESEMVPMSPQLASEPYSPLISIMTADFIFQTDNIFKHKFSHLLQIENIIYKAMRELCSGDYSSEKIQREINILYNISKYHNKLDFFLKIISTMKKRNNPLLVNDMISPNLIIVSTSRRKIFNVHQAAQFIFENRNIKRVYFKMHWMEVIFGSLAFKLKTYGMKGTLSRYLLPENLK